MLRMDVHRSHGTDGQARFPVQALRHESDGNDGARTEPEQGERGDRNSHAAPTKPAEPWGHAVRMCMSACTVASRLRRATPVYLQ
jgi:hypothetical protein